MFAMAINSEQHASEHAPTVQNSNSDTAFITTVIITVEIEPLSRLNDAHLRQQPPKFPTQMNSQAKRFIRTCRLRVRVRIAATHHQSESSSEQITPVANFFPRATTIFCTRLIHRLHKTNHQDDNKKIENEKKKNIKMDFLSLDKQQEKKVSDEEILI